MAGINNGCSGPVDLDGISATNMTLTTPTITGGTASGLDIQNSLVENSTLVDPLIKGNLMLDPTAQGALCGYLQECQFSANPEGAAGGDLSGTYPNPSLAPATVAGIIDSPQNRTIPKEDGYVAVTQPFPQSVLTTQHAKNIALLSPQDFGATGLDSGDDAGAITSLYQANSAMSVFNAAGGKFLCATPPPNLLGMQIYNGAVYTIAPQGGRIQHNSYGDIGKVVIGKENMYRVHKRIEVGGAITGAIFGDSTVAPLASGGGYAGTAHTPEVIVTKLLREVKNVSNPVNLTNYGVGGTNVSQINWLPALDQVTGSTDIFFIKYGINDAGLGVLGFAAALDNVLTSIRSNSFGTVNNLTIVLVGPNATYDPAHGRASPWYEQIRGVYENAARVHKCVFFDTYAYLRDISWAATYMMDNPFGDGSTVHPTKIMQDMIWAGVVDHLFTPSELQLVNYVEKTYPVSMTNGWVNYGGGFKPATSDMTNDGWVTVSGVVKSGTTASGTLLGTVNPAHAPRYQELFTGVAANDKVVAFRIDPDGNISIANTFADTQYVSLSGIRYRVLAFAT